MYNFAFIIVVVFSFSLLAKDDCGKSQAPGQKARDLYRNVSKASEVNKCIYFGKKSQSGEYKSAGVIYKTKTGYRVIFDGDDPMLMGAPIAQKVQLDTTGIECGDEFKGEIHEADLVGIDETFDKATKVSPPIIAYYPAGFCPGKSIRVNILAPVHQRTDELHIVDSASIPGDELFWLGMTEDFEKNPCKIKN